MGRTRAGKKEDLSFVDTARHMKFKKDLEEKRRNRKKRQEENKQKRKLASLEKRGVARMMLRTSLRFRQTPKS